MNGKTLPNNILKHIDLLCQLVLHVYTSSTAQGGGGSFKHGKPTGEVGELVWRKNGRANPLMD